jgi:hypothetical protein
MMARSTIAPRQRPDTLMQLSRSLILEAILYRAAGPYMLALFGSAVMSDLSPIRTKADVRRPL